MRYRLCFHKGGYEPDQKPPRIVQVAMSKIIKEWGDSPVSHVELQRGSGLCFSADGYANIVRFKQINFSHPERWIFRDLGEFTPEEDAAVVERMNKMAGWKYDYIGAFTSRWCGLHIPWRAFCSKAGCLALGWEPVNIDPGAMLKVADQWRIRT